MRLGKELVRTPSEPSMSHPLLHLKFDSPTRESRTDTKTERTSEVYAFLELLESASIGCDRLGISKRSEADSEETAAM